MPYKNSFATIKWILFQENSSSPLQLESSEIDNFDQEKEAIFKKDPTLDLPEVSNLIDSAISKRQEYQRNHSFLESKKILHKRVNGIISYLKMFSMQCRKNITVEGIKNKMNIANFINIYTNIYVYITRDENDSKWKWFNKLNTAA